MQINYHTYSHKLSSKPKNGDAVTVFEIPEENLMVFLVADGVGSCPGDYKASDTSIEQFELRFRETCAERSRSGANKESITDRIKHTINKVNQHILSVEGYYSGMKTTLVAVVIDKSHKQLYYTSIGDSRLYRFDESTVKQLSKDEVKAVIRRKQEGTPITQGGAIVNAVGVTNVLGVPEVACEIKTMPIEKSSSFLLATDGFYSKITDIDVYLPKMHKTLYFKNQFHQLAQDVARQQDDDASAIVFRCMLEDDNELWKAQQELFDQLLHFIEIKDEKEALGVTNIITFGGYENSFEFYDLAIKRMRALDFNSGTLYSALVGLLRESRRSN